VQGAGALSKALLERFGEDGMALVIDEGSKFEAIVFQYNWRSAADTYRQAVLVKEMARCLRFQA
jgi:hypothetical protein